MKPSRALSLIRRVAVTAALATGALTLASPARAATINCRPYYDYSVEVDGDYPKGAQFYQSDARGKYFIDIPACKSGLLMDLFAKKIVAVPRSLVSAVASGVQVQDGPSVGATSYAFSLEGAVIQFQAEDRKVRIVPAIMRPPIIGPVTIADLVADRPEYREGIKAYVPDAASIAVIGKYPRPIEIEAYFATWCPHCKEYMPKFLRVVEDARNPRLKLSLVGVPKGFGSTPGPWKDKGVAGIPTIIVKIDGHEVTRLGAGPGPGPEVELADTLKALR